MNKLDKDYQNLVRKILEEGREKRDRTGTGTISIFSHELYHDMADGFPLLTTKKMSLKNIKTELIWFLNGDTNIKFLVERGCNIWNGDAYKKYVQHQTANGRPVLSMKDFIQEIKTDDEFAEFWGDLGPIYGKQWRDWGGIDQINEILETLVKNPDSRRMNVNAWNVGELKGMTLPPCHYGFRCYTELLTHEERYAIWYEKNNDIGNLMYEPNMNIDFDAENIPTRRLSLKWEQRSVDTGLGLPYNIASYALLLMMLADEVNMVPGILAGSLTNVHIYNNHVDKIKEQLDREPMKLPKVIVRDGIHSHCDGDDIILQDYEHHPPIKLPLSN